ncbi:hypothetical protein [Roseimaritima sediminicola]|uniref:hypothetical protein n=1 Tax=Roseimaritima sediminicola TaxID=2662066 RepID=UPI00129838C0|nr:hypothetical protein [Roseimaritima sediminicola]
MNYALMLSSALAVCLLTGCSDDWRAETYPATGRVTVNGQAASGAVVTLHPVGEKVDERNSRPYAIVGEDGSFTLETYESGDGAPVGEYDLTITWPVDTSKMELAMLDRLDGKFARPEQSQWKVNITEGENEIPSIEISGVRLIDKQRAAQRRRVPRGPEQGGGS